MDILAIDYGEKKTGLAIAKKDMGVAMPFGKLKADSKEIRKKKIKEIIKKEKIKTLVVGLPFSLDRSENRNTKKIRKFAKEIQQEIDIEIEFIDETFTSKEADSMGGNVSQDEKAAMLILNAYLEK